MKKIIATMFCGLALGFVMGQLYMWDRFEIHDFVEYRNSTERMVRGYEEELAKMRAEREHILGRPSGYAPAKRGSAINPTGFLGRKGISYPKTFDTFRISIELTTSRKKSPRKSLKDLKRITDFTRTSPLVKGAEVVSVSGVVVKDGRKIFYPIGRDLE